nr:MAG TPA: hypothetical protein [Caudoviricetes sp.]
MKQKRQTPKRERTNTHTKPRQEQRKEVLAGNKLSVKQSCAVHTLESVSKSKGFENRKRKR